MASSILRFRATFLIVIAALFAIALSGCSRLGMFNLVVPKDAGSQIVATGVAYGEDPRQKLDIYAPASAVGKAPVIVFVYGGSWNSGSRQDYAFVGRTFASRGFLTVVFDYRLVPKIRYPEFVRDGAKALAWVRGNIGAYGGDPARLHVVGHSAGAYNALMLALAPEFLAREGLPANTIKAVAGLSGPYDFLPLAVPETTEAFAGVKDLEGTQPVIRARRGGRFPPVLLIHGEEDSFVLPRNSRVLAAALRAGGHLVREIYYPEIDHVGTLLAISRPLRQRAAVVDDIVDFLRGIDRR
jgi:acetyl esterase/lipase